MNARQPTEPTLLPLSKRHQRFFLVRVLGPRYETATIRSASIRQTSPMVLGQRRILLPPRVGPSVSSV